MRITSQQQIQTNNTQEIKKAAGQLPQKGELIKGVLVDVVGIKLTLSIGGKPITVLNQSDQSFVKGQTVTLEVVSATDEAIIAKAVKPQSDSMSPILSKLGLSQSSENRALVETMVKYNVPITPENIQIIKSQVSEMKALTQEMATKELTLNEVAIHERSVREVVLDLMKSPSQENANMTKMIQNESPLNTDIQVRLANNQSEVITSKTVDLPTEGQEPKQGEGLSQQETKELLNLLKDIVIKLEGKANETESNLKENATPQMSQNSESNQTLRESVVDDKQLIKSDAGVEVLKGFNLEDSTAMVKNQIDFNVKNTLLYKAMAHDVKNIGDSFKTLVGLVDKLDSKMQMAILDIIQQADLSEAQKLETLKGLLLTSTLSNQDKEKATNEATFIKEATTLVKQSDETVFMMQMPLQYEALYPNVNLYMKTKKGKVDQDDMTLLIALSTHHCGEVRCIIEKNKDQFTLNFKFENQEVMDLFKASEETFKKQLTDLSINLKGIRFALSQGEVKETLIEEPVNHLLDIKI